MTKLEREFLDEGLVAVRGAFSREAAAERVALAAAGLKGAAGTVSLPGRRSFTLKEFAPRAYEAVCALVGGAGRIAQGERLSVSDCFVVKPPSGQQWQAPSADYLKNWHLDRHETRRRLEDPYGLQLFLLWTDVAPRGGGTFLALDSPAGVARAFAGAPGGVEPGGLPVYSILSRCRRFLELTGEAGDVFIAHPMMLHAESVNASRTTRYLTARVVELSAPLELRKPSSAVERSIAGALREAAA